MRKAPFILEAAVKWLREALRYNKPQAAINLNTTARDAGIIVGMDDQKLFQASGENHWRAGNSAYSPLRGREYHAERLLAMWSQ